MRQLIATRVMSAIGLCTRRMSRPRHEVASANLGLVAVAGLTLIGLLLRVSGFHQSLEGDEFLAFSEIHGGSDASGACLIDSPAALRATGDILTALHDAGPVDWLGQRWYELAIDFAHGHYGLIVDSDHYVAFFEDPAVSAVKGKVAYALPPVGPSGGRRANLWTWSIP